MYGLQIDWYNDIQDLNSRQGLVLNSAKLFSIEIDENNQTNILLYSFQGIHHYFLMNFFASMNFLFRTGDVLDKTNLTDSLRNQKKILSLLFGPGKCHKNKYFEIFLSVQSGIRNISVPTSLLLLSSDGEASLALPPISAYLPSLSTWYIWSNYS